MLAGLLRGRPLNPGVATPHISSLGPSRATKLSKVDTLLDKKFQGANSRPARHTCSLAASEEPFDLKASRCVCPWAPCKLTVRYMRSKMLSAAAGAGTVEPRTYVACGMSREKPSARVRRSLRVSSDLVQKPPGMVRTARRRKTSPSSNTPRNNPCYSPAEQDLMAAFTFGVSLPAAGRATAPVMARSSTSVLKVSLHALDRHSEGLSSHVCIAPLPNCLLLVTDAYVLPSLLCAGSTSA